MTKQQCLRLLMGVLSGKERDRESENKLESKTKVPLKCLSQEERKENKTKNQKELMKTSGSWPK